MSKQEDGMRKARETLDSLLNEIQASVDPQQVEDFIDWRLVFDKQFNRIMAITLENKISGKLQLPALLARLTAHISGISRFSPKSDQLQLLASQATRLQLPGE